MSARVNYTMTPDLTFELYGQPFTATGTYSDIREVSATPAADSYDARFRPFGSGASPSGFNVKRFTQRGAYALG